jgi:hypothetical protein
MDLKKKMAMMALQTNGDEAKRMDDAHEETKLKLKVCACVWCVF